MTTQQATQVQLTIDDFLPAQGKARRDAPETSKEAAALLSPSGIRADWLRLLRYLVAHPLSTDEQMQDGLPLAASSQRPRRGEVAARGWIECADSDGRTKAGRRAQRWRVTEAGLAVLAQVGSAQAGRGAA